jgi:thiol-disulfide isomerase/thioredoxin
LRPARLRLHKKTPRPAFESGRYQVTILRPQLELPSIKLFRVEGAAVDLSSLRGKPILLNFWASWCAACRTELPILERQYSKVWRGDLQVAAVSEDRGGHETIARFVRELDVRSLPIYLDPNGYVAFADRENRRHAPWHADHLSRGELRIGRRIHARCCRLDVSGGEQLDRISPTLVTKDEGAERYLVRRTSSTSGTEQSGAVLPVQRETVFDSNVSSLLRSSSFARI